MNKTVLISDNEPRTRAVLFEFLQRGGYNVLQTADGEDALNKVFDKKQSIDLIVMDLTLPKIDGFTVIEKVRECFKTPIIILTAINDDCKQIKCFKMGVDDYVLKPFSPAVLVARIDNILKNARAAAIVLGNIKISDFEREVYLDNKPIKMTPKEYELLKYLILNKGMALSRERILNAVWNYDYLGDLRTVDTHIKQLRKKLKKSGQKIITVRNIGYKMTD